MKKAYRFVLVVMFISGCSANKADMLGDDIRIYKDTPAWKLAKTVKSEDIDDIKQILKDDTSLITFPERKFGQT